MLKYKEAAAEFDVPAAASVFYHHSFVAFFCRLKTFVEERLRRPCGVIRAFPLSHYCSFWSSVIIFGPLILSF